MFKLNYSNEKQKSLEFVVIKAFNIDSVPGAGVEPAQYCYHWCLRPARLPVPPSGRLIKLVDIFSFQLFIKNSIPIFGMAELSISAVCLLGKNTHREFS